ncbi:type II secretion system protein [Sulfurimonas sp.]
MNKSKNAFTMIEMVFVIVVLGILASIAIPRLSATRTDAVITKGRADIASIRSAIVTERQSRLITGDSAYIDADDLDNADGLFGGVLMYGITSGTGSGDWSSTGVTDMNTTSYNFNSSGVNVLFTYTKSDGKFVCITTNGTYGAQCTALVN